VDISAPKKATYEVGAQKAQMGAILDAFKGPI
jgi:hypothetical protein